MTLRRIQLSIVAIVLFMLFLAPANWTFEGCWEPNLGSTCRDVYRDDQGNYWICRACGTTGNPTPGKCSPISSATLATGFWCS